MATALTLTAQPGTASVLVEVTGAPAPVTKYQSDFSAGVDGWVDATAYTYLGWAGPGSGYGISVTAALGPGKATRAVSGLTVGHRYRVKAPLAAVSYNRFRLGADGIGATAWRYGTGLGNYIATTYEFTATATTHSITIEPDGGPSDPNGAVYVDDDVQLVDVTGIDGVTTLLRVDANGSRPVRLLDGQEPIGGVMTVTDYEPALLGVIRYDLTDGAGVTVSDTTTLEGLVELPWLHVPVLPAYREDLDLITGYGATRESTNVVHDVIDSTFPAVTLGVPRSRTGTLDIFATDYTEALAVVAVAATLGEVVMLRQPTFPGMDMYFTPGDTRVDPDRGRWKVSVPYVEVAYPAGPLLGAVGWSFADAQAAAEPSFSNMAALWPTFADLAVGPP